MFLQPVLSALPNLLPAGGEVFYVPSFFTPAESDDWLSYLQQNISWKQEPIRLFGKEVMQPRLTAWLGEKNYSYSGITMAAHPFPQKMLALKERLDSFAGTRFNSALLNLYRDGNDSMGWHRDNEAALGKEPVIASVSFGGARRFLFRNYADKRHKISLELQHGSLLLMRGLSQQCWEHSLPKSKKSTDVRINLTFRVIL